MDPPIPEIDADGEMGIGVDEGECKFVRETLSDSMNEENRASQGWQVESGR
jgi:hypothetical protein